MQVQPIFRRALLGVADDPRVEAAVRRSSLVQGLVRRFVAGEDAAAALDAARDIAGQGMTTTLDQLGENVATEEEAAAASAAYVALLERMAAARLEPNISVKLTMLGLDLGDEAAGNHLRPVLAAARAVGGFVRIDMEGSAYTARTLAITERVHEEFPDHVGTVIQSALRRSAHDLERLIARRMRVRLVKGAYAEPEAVAFQSPAAVDAAYARLTERLLDDGRYPALATHDPALIRAATRYAGRWRLAKTDFEFQMLYGVRREAQAELAAAGYRVRIYVPFGHRWYPYFARRIAERPANAFFVLRQMVDR